MRGAERKSATQCRRGIGNAMPLPVTVAAGCLKLVHRRQGHINLVVENERSVGLDKLHPTSARGGRPRPIVIEIANMLRQSGWRAVQHPQGEHVVACTQERLAAASEFDDAGWAEEILGHAAQTKAIFAACVAPGRKDHAR